MKDALLRIYARFETIVVGTLLFLMMLVVLIAAGEFVYLLVFGLVDHFRELDSIEFMQSEIHLALAGVLVVLLGLELTETVKMYLIERVIHVEVVFVVALIAVARHVITLDYEHAEPLRLFAVSALVLALTGGYYLLRRVDSSSRRSSLDRDPDTGSG